MDSFWVGIVLSAGSQVIETWIRCIPYLNVMCALLPGVMEVMKNKNQFRIKRTEGSEKTERWGSKTDAAEEELKEIVDQLKTDNSKLTFLQIWWSKLANYETPLVSG